MELKLKDNKFYILLYKEGADEHMSAFDDMSTSIKSIKEVMRKVQISSDLQLMLIQYEGGTFRTKTIPWDIIAMELAKE
jgi:hypothetical protein